MFFLVILAHSDEQYNNLLKTRGLIIVINLRLSIFYAIYLTKATYTFGSFFYLIEYTHGNRVTVENVFSPYQGDMK